jgi:hypoxanthine phosphoribosyltransferase
VVIGILNGAFIFAADLIREMGMRVELDFMRLSSYGSRDVPDNKVCITKDIEIDIKGRDVLIVEDIVDRGLTLKAIIGHLETREPAGIKVCSLLLRSGSEQAGLVDFVGQGIDEGFVVGYGMDYKERYRELKGLYIMETGGEL